MRKEEKGKKTGPSSVSFFEMLLRKFNFFRHSQVKQIFDCRIFTFQNACDLLFCIVDTDVLESSGISRGLHVFDFRCHHICGCQWDQFRISFLSGSLVVFAVFHLTLKWQRNIALKQLHESKQLLNFSNYMKNHFLLLWYLSQLELESERTKSKQQSFQCKKPPVSVQHCWPWEACRKA